MCKHESLAVRGTEKNTIIYIHYIMLLINTHSNMCLGAPRSVGLMLFFVVSCCVILLCDCAFNYVFIIQNNHNPLGITRFCSKSIFNRNMLLCPILKLSTANMCVSCVYYIIGFTYDKTCGNTYLYQTLHQQLKHTCCLVFTCFCSSLYSLQS